MEALSADEHPGQLLRDEICEEVGELCREKKNVDCSAVALRNLFESFRIHRHSGRFDEATDCLRDLLTRSLLAAAKEYKQMGHCRDLGTVQSRLYYGFKTYENRGKFQRRMDDIQQSLAAVVGRQGVITQTEKLELAKSYETVAANCLKAIITSELEQQKLAQNQAQELAPEMAMTM